MKWLWFGTVIFLCIGTAYSQTLEYGKVYTPTSGMSADEIMRINYQNKYSLFAQDTEKEGVFLTVDASGFTRKRVWKRERLIKGGEDGISYKDLLYVTYPAELKGLAVLTWNYVDPDKDQEVWLWLPSLKKVRKVSASEDDDALMGTDFTVEEVSTRRFEDETYRLIGEEEFKGYTFEYNGELKDQGTPCFVIECIPKKPHWYYAKRIAWVNKEIGGVLFDEYYDKNGKLFKTIYREWALLKSGENSYPSEISLECKDLRTGHRTVILMDIPLQLYDQGLSEQDFTVKALMRSRW